MVPTTHNGMRQEYGTIKPEGRYNFLYSGTHVSQAGHWIVYFLVVDGPWHTRKHSTIVVGLVELLRLL